MMDFDHSPGPCAGPTSELRPRRFPDVRLPLDAFPPSGKRAAFLHKRLAKQLGRSVGQIAHACAGKVTFDGAAVDDFCDRLAASKAVHTSAYVAYFDLLDAARQGDGERLEGLLEALPHLELSPGHFHVVNWGGPELNSKLAERYLHYVNIEPSAKPLIFQGLRPDKFQHMTRVIEQAFRILDAGAPEVGREVRELVRELVLVSDPGTPGSMQFDGATSFYCWGALFLNADRHEDVMDLVDGLAHETAHAHLFGVSLGNPFVENPPEERHPSPLRAEPRPLDGIFHAAYVSARMHYAHHRLLGAGVLGAAEAAEAEKGREVGRRAFIDGVSTLDQHARLTPLGGKVMAAAQAYMQPFV